MGCLRRSPDSKSSWLSQSWTCILKYISTYIGSSIVIRGNVLISTSTETAHATLSATSRMFHCLVVRSFLRRRKDFSLRLAEKVSLLCTGTESGLLSRWLESVGLENALQGLGRRTLASSSASSWHGSHRRSIRWNGSMFRHFVLSWDKLSGWTQ